MTKEQLDSFTAEMIRSRLFICVAVDDKGRSQEMFCGDPYKLIDVAFNTLLSMIDELETTEEQIVQIRTRMMFLNAARIAKEKAPEAAATALSASVK